MHNKGVEAFLDGCDLELTKITAIVTLPEDSGTAKEANIIRVESLPFLTKYSLIKACGTIELCFKTLVSECVTSKDNARVSKYLDETFLSRGINPKIGAMANYLRKFDDAWAKEFEAKVQAKDSRIITSVKYLVDERNKHAHGKDTRIGLQEVKECFAHGRMAIEILDEMLLCE